MAVFGILQNSKLRKNECFQAKNIHYSVANNFVKFRKRFCAYET
jgi:hypothetical protein